MGVMPGMFRSKAKLLPFTTPRRCEWSTKAQPECLRLVFYCLPDKLKKIDLTANEITSIEDRTFIGLPELEEVIIRENHISQLPALPETMILIDASHNNIGSKGIHKEAFKVRTPFFDNFLFMRTCAWMQS